MNKTKIAYWASTVIFSAIMLLLAINYFISPDIVQAFEHLGFPDYFRVELGIAKMMGAILLLLPFKGRINEWIYAGFTINLISAIIAHIASGDSVSTTILAWVLLVLLAVSYVTHHKLSRDVS
ncbi:DoxX family protein [Rhodohalobacter sp. 614A]|uniref:DoxX family protein n=1 Tax=Rhodohalobacter sp. 614A TaxID=2908649 RepID=UPI001F228898|nr:DoxX family protein [Rhodohalobacter sp. 614A]